jgi:photosystem II stability/assembly factor-like uncharacterized protein
MMNGNGISALRFANASSGWAFGPELWATHDGAATWKRVTIGGLAVKATVLALEASAGFAHAVAYDADADFRIATTGTGADEWRLSETRVPVGAGPVPQIQLVLSGASGWVLQNDRVATNGARLDAGIWKAWDPPCVDLTGPALLAASSPRDLVAVCDVGLWSNPVGERLFVSSDGGANFTAVGGRMPISSVGAVATPDKATIVVGGSNATGSALLTSADGGRTWPSVVSAGNTTIVQLGFTTQTQGLVITRTESDLGRMLMTHDAGRTWERVAF